MKRGEAISLVFVECGTCRAKSGSPTLCPSCQHNRMIIDILTYQLVEIQKILETNK